MLEGGGGIGGGLGGAIGGIIALATDKGLPKEFKQAVATIRGTPEDLNFDMRSVTPEEARLVAEMFPDVYQAAFPDQVSLAEDSLPGRDAQLYVMEELRRRSQEGEPVGERISNQLAQNTLAGEIGRGQQNFMTQLAQRGRVDPGSYFQARQGFGQESANLARDMALDRERENITNRLGALRSLAGVAGEERGQTQNLSQGRSDAINRFNEFVANLGTQQNRYAADARNQANMYNTETRQRLADYNSQNRQALNVRNQDTQNQLRLQQGGYGLDRAGLLAQQLQLLGRAKDAEEAARQQNIRGIGQGVGSAAGGLLGGII